MASRNVHGRRLCRSRGTPKLCGGVPGCEFGKDGGVLKDAGYHNDNCPIVLITGVLQTP